MCSFFELCRSSCVGVAENIFGLLSELGGFWNVCGPIPIAQLSQVTWMGLLQIWGLLLVDWQGKGGFKQTTDRQTVTGRPCWSLGPVHTGCGAPCNMCAQIMEHIVANGSVHTACKQHQSCKQICVQMCWASCVNGPKTCLNLAGRMGACACNWRKKTTTIHYQFGRSIYFPNKKAGIHSTQMLHQINLHEAGMTSMLIAFLHPTLNVFSSAHKNTQKGQRINQLNFRTEKILSTKATHVSFASWIEIQFKLFVRFKKVFLLLQQRYRQDIFSTVKFLFICNWMTISCARHDKHTPEKNLAAKKN